MMALQSSMEPELTKLDDFEFQNFCEKYRGHLPCRGVTTSAETAGKASCRNRRATEERYWIDRAVEIHAGGQYTMVRGHSVRAKRFVSLSRPGITD
jgi:hypothetical protein